MTFPFGTSREGSELMGRDDIDYFLEAWADANYSFVYVLPEPDENGVVRIQPVDTICN